MQPSLHSSAGVCAEGHSAADRRRGGSASASTTITCAPTARSTGGAKLLTTMFDPLGFFLIAFGLFATLVELARYFRHRRLSAKPVVNPRLVTDTVPAEAVADLASAEEA